MLLKLDVCSLEGTLLFDFQVNVNGGRDGGNFDFVTGVTLVLHGQTAFIKPGAPTAGLRQAVGARLVY